MLYLPVIDISSMFSQDPAMKLLVAKQINAACKEFGFFLLTGHGVSAEFMANYYGCLKKFFNLPIQEKSKYILNRSSATTYNDVCPYGYTAINSENVYAFMGEKGPNDLVEKISAGPAILRDEPTKWLPNEEQVPHLKQMMRQHYNNFHRIATELSRLFALAVDLPEDFFVKEMDQSCDTIRCQLYPKLRNKDQNNGIAPHTDFSFLSIITQEVGCDGLELLNQNQEWQLIKIPSIDTFVVNIGNIMMRWSNNEWISTKHRVLLTDSYRLSTAFFKLINEDAVIEYIPKFIEQREARYKPIDFGSFLTQKMMSLVNIKDQQEQISLFIPPNKRHKPTPFK